MDIFQVKKVRMIFVVFDIIEKKLRQFYRKILVKLKGGDVVIIEDDFFDEFVEFKIFMKILRVMKFVKKINIFEVVFKIF